MNLRKIVTTITIAGLFFWAPSVIPVKAAPIGPCGVPLTWLPADTAFAIAPITPCPTPGHGSTSVPFAIVGCASGIILAALAANARDHRELTAQEAWTCGILFWFSSPRKMHR
jgi:hypothetical protein